MNKWIKCRIITAWEGIFFCNRKAESSWVHWTRVAFVPWRTWTQLWDLQRTPNTLGFWLWFTPYSSDLFP